MYICANCGTGVSDAAEESHIIGKEWLSSDDMQVEIKSLSACRWAERRPWQHAVKA